MSSRILVAIAGVILAIGMAQAASVSDLKVGQKWSVKGSGLTLVIGRIEPYPPNKTVISISVFDVPCPPGTGCKKTVVAHAPFDADALANSVDKLIDTNAATAPAFESGYAQWKQANGGVFTVPVSKLTEILFKTIEKTEHKP